MRLSKDFVVCRTLRWNYCETWLFDSHRKHDRLVPMKRLSSFIRCHPFNPYKMKDTLHKSKLYCTYGKRQSSSQPPWEGLFWFLQGEVCLCWIIDPRGRLNDNMMCHLWCIKKNLITDEVIIPNLVDDFSWGFFIHLYIISKLVRDVDTSTVWGPSNPVSVVSASASTKTKCGGVRTVMTWMSSIYRGVIQNHPTLLETT